MSGIAISSSCQRSEKGYRKQAVNQQEVCHDNVCYLYAWMSSGMLVSSQSTHSVHTSSISHAYICIYSMTHVKSAGFFFIFIVFKHSWYSGFWPVGGAAVVQVVEWELCWTKHDWFNPSTWERLWTPNLNSKVANERTSVNEQVESCQVCSM